MKLCRVRFVSALIALLGAAATGAAAAASGRSVDIPERIKGSAVVVVATTGSVSARWRESAYGDRVIVSSVVLHVEEALKGTSQPTVTVEVDGGTLNGVTLRVSDLPELKAGERAVFFLDQGQSTPAFVPHLRGLGILKVDAANTISGSTLSLDDIRRMAQSLGK